MKQINYALLGMLIFCICIIIICCVASRDMATRLENSEVALQEQTIKLENLEATLHYSELETLRLMEKSLEAKNKLSNSNNETVTVSFYCPKLGGINGKVGNSASGEKLKDGWSVAISRDLLDRGWYGTKIDLYGENLPLKFRGVHFSSDKMAKKNPYTGEAITKQIDVFVSDPSMIPNEGIFKNVKVSKIIKY